MDWENIFMTHITHITLIILTYKEHQCINKKMTINPIRQWPKGLNRQFTEEEIQIGSIQNMLKVNSSCNQEKCNLN
jgi:hypothetical protein